MSKLDRIDPALLASNPRCSQAAWFRYRSIALAAFRQHPRIYVCHSTTLSPQTIASRLREAIRGCLAFHYPLDPEGILTHDDLLRWYSETTIKFDAENCIIGPQEAVTEELQTSRVSPGGKNLSFHELTLEEIIAFTILLSTQRLSGPVTIFQPPDVSLVPQRENVEMLARADGSLVLM